MLRMEAVRAMAGIHAFDRLQAIEESKYKDRLLPIHDCSVPVDPLVVPF
jgi:hypothetical protein